MILEGRSISKGKAEGKVLKLEGALSFLGGVDASTGELKVENGGNVADRILVFPRGKGSTVGSFVMYDLKVHGKAPSAVINASAETIVATGAVISSIPMIDSVDVDLIKDGDEVLKSSDEMLKRFGYRRPVLRGNEKASEPSKKGNKKEDKKDDKKKK